MKRLSLYVLAVLAGIFFLAACGTQEPQVDVDEVTSQPQEFVGSDTCKTCHLEHFDSWRMTMHSRMLQDAKENRDAIVVELDEERIRADLAKLGDNLKVPADEIWVPDVEDVLYTIGGQWKQRYVVERDGILYISPIQYNVDTDRFVNYHENDWLERPWILKCGGCHATGADIEAQTITEPAVGCEACHGKGSHHVALPKTQIFDKRQTIINPSKLTPGVAVQICGSCHNRGHATKKEGAGWPVGYEPGKALSAYYESTSYESGDVKHVYANEFSKGHHQQYIDWVQSEHFKEGVNCTTCHYVHQLGIPSTRSQTFASGSNQCLSCHQVINNNLAHSIHSFANCIGCHMPRIAKSAESGDIHSHVFVALLPEDTLRNEVIPNSCQTCHKHKDDDLKELQAKYDALAILPKPRGQVVAPIGGPNESP